MAWQFSQYTSSPLGLLPQGEFSYKQSGGTNDSQGSRFSTKNSLSKSADNENGLIKWRNLKMENNIAEKTCFYYHKELNKCCKK